MTINLNELITKYLKKKEKIQNNINFNNELFLDYLKDDFSYQIKERGKDYYEKNKVISCYKTDTRYYAKVTGSLQKPYNVNFDITEDEIEYHCDCPCEFPCKHEYAVLLAIDNNEYKEVKLKPQIASKNYDITDIIKCIPAENLKEYLLTPFGLDNIFFEKDDFKNKYIKYYPNEDYEFYYNNLYNTIVLDENIGSVLNLFLKKVNQYINNQVYDEAYKIILSIINSFEEVNKLNEDESLIKNFPVISMYLRVIYRKCDNNLKEKMNSWIEELQKNNYYNNLFLEDAIIMIMDV